MECHGCMMCGACSACKVHMRAVFEEGGTGTGTEK